jgi:hypothetical protein
MLPTSVWGHDTLIFGARFAAQIGILFAGALALQIFPERASRPVLVLEGLACLLVMGPIPAAVFLALLMAWFVMLALPLPAIARVLLAAGALLLLGLCGARGLLKNAYAFSMMYSLRLIMYAWDQWQKNFPPPKLRPYLVYLLAAPLIVFPPYLTFIPAFDKHETKITPRLSTLRTRRAFEHFGWSLVFAFVASLAATAPWVDREGLPFILFRYALAVSKIAVVAHVTFAFLLLHGMDDRLPIDNPLLSTDYVQYWNRFQIHQKDLQVNLFYTPALFRLRKGNRYVAIMLALTWTLLLWNTVMHVLIRYVFYKLPAAIEHTEVALIINGVNTIVIGGTLCVEHWRRATKNPAPRTFVWNAMCWTCTMLFAATTTT